MVATSLSTDSTSGGLQFVFVSLAGWGVLIYGGYKLFAGGSKEKKDTAPAESSASTPAHH
jgi:threonine/homoserine/homoserine lactone efflux protein